MYVRRMDQVVDLRGEISNLSHTSTLIEKSTDKEPGCWRFKPSCQRRGQISSNGHKELSVDCRLSQEKLQVRNNGLLYVTPVGSNQLRTNSFKKQFDLIEQIRRKLHLASNSGTQPVNRRRWVMTVKLFELCQATRLWWLGSWIPQNLPQRSEGAATEMWNDKSAEFCSPEWLSKVKKELLPIFCVPMIPKAIQVVFWRCSKSLMIDQWNSCHDCRTVVDSKDEQLYCEV